MTEDDFYGKENCLISTFAPGKYWNPAVSVRVSGEHEDLKRRLEERGY